MTLHRFALASAILLIAGPTADALAAAWRKLPLVRLAAPDGTPLNGDEIRGVFSGKRLLLDAHYVQSKDVELRVATMGGCPPIELFYADQRWERGICGVMYHTDRGLWRVRGNTLCTRSNASNEQCRVVWQAGALDRVIMNVPEATGEYSPYRLRPITKVR